MNSTKARILIVDDDRDILIDFKHILEMDYEVDTVSNPNEALSLVIENKYQVIISDYEMPGMSGIKFLRKVMNFSPDSARILVTGHADINVAIDSINSNHIFRFLLKPVPPETFLQVVKDAHHYYLLKITEREILEKTLKGCIKVLIDIISIKNDYNFTQSAKYIELVKKIGEKIEYKYLWEIELAAILCKIGYISIDKSVINKYLLAQPMKPGEVVEYYNHPNFGHKLLVNIPRLERIAEGILYQYNRFDGKNPFQNNISGKNIPLIARILNVANDFVIYSNIAGNTLEALKKMQLQYRRYDPAILSSLITITVGNLNFPTSDEYKITINLSDYKEDEDRNILWYSLDEFKEGMILGEDILSSTGIPLVGKGTVVTETLKEYIKSKSEPHNIKRLIKIKQASRFGADEK